MTTTGEFKHTPFIPFDPTVRAYGTFLGYAQPAEFTSWQDEVLSWKNTAYIHAGLNPTQTLRVSGPDALRLLSEHCVNSFQKFSIGAAKHAIMCNDDGLIEAHGVLLREGEDSFLTYWLAPWLPIVAASGQYDVKIEDITGETFLFQIAGPRSLEILEAATGESLRDIRFLRSRPSNIAGLGDGGAVNVLRVGMAGSLAYELHGPISEAELVYKAILKAGEAFGLRRLGAWRYFMNHTENGFPQGGLHFLFPCWLDGRFAADPDAPGGKWNLTGSASDNIALSFRNPIDVGWGHVVKFDHEFQGRAALEDAAANPRKKIVTLVWDPEDVLDIYRSYFQPDDHYQFIEFVRDRPLPVSAEFFDSLHQDYVLQNGKVVGVSSSRIYSYYYRKMISLCSIDVEESEIGTQVTVVHGEPGSRQKEIRATVERFPFYNENRNEKVDVLALGDATR
jgi:glycine cleavage system aminomethyltransferase T